MGKSGKTKGMANGKLKIAKEKGRPRIRTGLEKRNVN